MSKENLPDENLKGTLDEAEWLWLKPHIQRDGVIIVAQELDLLEVGIAFSTDNSSRVEGWIKTKRISKPTAEQILSWDQTPGKKFQSLVVQPYVLIQELKGD